MTSQARFWAEVTTDGRAFCLMRGIGTCDGKIDAHHMLSKQRLRSLHWQACWDKKTYPELEHSPLAGVELDDLLSDPRNGAPLCRRHHTIVSVCPIPQERVPQAVFDFALEYGVEHHLPYEIPVAVGA